MQSWLAFLVAAAATVGCAGRPAGRPVGNVRLSGVTPDFHQIPLATIDGQSTSLAAELGTRAALVNFWAPWCEPCVRELPDLARLAAKMASCGVTVLGVAVGEKPEVIARFAEQRRLGYRQMTDEHFALSDAMGQMHIPTTMVFDANQRVVFVGAALDVRAEIALAEAAAAIPGAIACKIDGAGPR